MDKKVIFDYLKQVPRKTKVHKEVKELRDKLELKDLQLQRLKEMQTGEQIAKKKEKEESKEESDWDKLQREYDAGK